MGSKNILIVCEGEATEQQIINNLQKIFFKDYIFNNYKISFQYYGNHVYSFYEMYTDLKKDEYIGIIALLKENYTDKIKRLQNSKSQKGLDKLKKKLCELKEIEHTNPQVFLFFDYDAQGQNTKYSDENIKELLEFFSDETDNGKLYISYPMVEALKDFKKFDVCNRRCTVPAKTNIKYKNLANNESDFKDIRKLNEEYWFSVSEHSIKKSNCIIDTCGKYLLPDNYKQYQNNFSQNNIFEKQILKFVINDKIAVLSAFPFFLIDYFGERFYEKITQNNGFTNILKIGKENCL